MTSFEDFYGSFLAQPVLLWGAGVGGLLVVLLRRSTSRSVRTFGVAFGLVSLLDAWLTADRVAGVGSLGPALGVAVATFFVIVGDFRVFLFLASATAEGEIAIDGGKAARAALWSLVVPLASTVFRSSLPDRPWRGRATFLFYEVAFACLMLGLRFLGQGVSSPWRRHVVRYVVAYYALWAVADGMILGFHLDAGYLVRVVPNVLYYGGLVAVVSLFAPTGSSLDARRA
jgi:hypothetical protein